MCIRDRYIYCIPCATVTRVSAPPDCLEPYRKTESDVCGYIRQSGLPNNGNLFVLNDIFPDIHSSTIPTKQSYIQISSSDDVRVLMIA